MGTELSLAAALRDARSGDAAQRNVAVRNLAAGLLREAKLTSPCWAAANRHPQGTEVLAALRRALEDDEAPTRGLALVGLSQLGEKEIIETASAWLDAPDPEVDDALEDRVNEGRRVANAFARECGVIALSLLGEAARNAERPAIRKRCTTIVGGALGSEHPDVRFQAAVALGELGGRDAERALVAALGTEPHPEVRSNLVMALSFFDPPGSAACERLIEVLASDDGPTQTGFEAALALTNARRPEGGPRLVEALAGKEARENRDRALEGLAVLGPDAPEGAAAAVEALASRWWGMPVTRVRAAYALARLDPARGLPLLERMAGSVRPAVRGSALEAIDAIAALDTRSAGPERNDPDLADVTEP